MSIVFSCWQKWAGFSDGDFRDDGSTLQHVGPETASAREPYVTVLVRGWSRSPWAAACSWRRVVTAESGEQSDDGYVGSRSCWHLNTRRHSRVSTLVWPTGKGDADCQAQAEVYGQICSVWQRIMSTVRSCWECVTCDNLDIICLFFSFFFFAFMVFILFMFAAN